MPRTVKTLLTFLLLAGIIGLGSCTKNTTANPAGNDTTINSKRPFQKNVYVLGFTHDSLVYWKNDTPVLIEKSPGSYIYSGISMAVSGGHVYICGDGGDFTTIPLVTTPCIWVDGVRSTLPDNSGNASTAAIAVNGSDVYVAGNNGSEVLLWKSGVASALDSPMVYSSNYASGMYLSGSDVYVLGGNFELYPGDPKDHHYAEYWKNGVFHSLDSGVVDTAGGNLLLHPQTFGIAVSGNDVYACGVTIQPAPNGSGVNFQPIYWKNSVPIQLPNSTPSAVATCIAVAGDTVYVAGRVNDQFKSNATVWTNGVANVLSTNVSYVYGIAVSGSDVYVVGNEYINGVSYATYWLNGVATHLSPSSNATAIVIQ
jgi:hypothetical protein